MCNQFSILPLRARALYASPAQASPGPRPGAYSLGAGVKLW